MGTQSTMGTAADRASRIRRDVTTAADGIKPGFLTSEFITIVAVALLVLAAAAASANFQADEAWPLIAFMAIGYSISRGLAKSGGFGRDRR